MKEKIKEFYELFLNYFLWFIGAVAVLNLIELGNFLMNYPNDIAFYTGLFLNLLCICTIGYIIFKKITKDDK